MYKLMFKSLRFFYKYFPAFFLYLAGAVLVGILGTFSYYMTPVLTTTFTSHNVLIHLFAIIKEFWSAFALNALISIASLLILSFAYTATTNIILNHETKKVKHVSTNFHKVFLFSLFIGFAYLIAILIFLLLPTLWLKVIWGIILLIISIAVFLRFFLVPVFLVRTDETIKEAISKSWETTKNHFWYIILFVIIVEIIQTILFALTNNLNENITLIIDIIASAILGFWTISYMCEMYLQEKQ